MSFQPSVYGKGGFVSMGPSKVIPWVEVVKFLFPDVYCVKLINLCEKNKSDLTKVGVYCRVVL